MNPYFAHTPNFERIRELYAMLAGIPADLVDLKYWRENQDRPNSTEELLHGCGTTACVIGFASAYPLFNEQGLKWSKTWNEPVFYSKGTSMDVGFEAVQSFFKTTYSEARRLFSQVSQGNDLGPIAKIQREDVLFPHKDKRKALARIRNFLAMHKELTLPRYLELKAYEASLDQGRPTPYLP